MNRFSDALVWATEVHRPADARPEVVRVSLADKVHNARSLLFVFRRVSASPLVDELDRVVTELECLAERDASL